MFWDGEALSGDKMRLNRVILRNDRLVLVHQKIYMHSIDIAWVLLKGQRRFHKVPFCTGFLAGPFRAIRIRSVQERPNPLAVFS